jgi:hypothetical protein
MYQCLSTEKTRKPLLVVLSIGVPRDALRDRVDAHLVG